MSVTYYRRARVAALIPRLPRRAQLLTVALAALLALLGGAWLWFRDSSLVAVKRVSIVGVAGPDVSAIERALRSAALTMTTLDVNMGQLRTAVQPYPDVRSLSVSTHFPHTIVIRVSEQVPVALVTVSGRTIPVAGDGTLLSTRAAPSGSLPAIALRVPPGGTHLTEPGARAALAVLAAAPYALLPHIQQASWSAQHGVVISLRSGPAVYFGDATRLQAKWESAVAVLGDPGSRGAQYLDVSDPDRPAAGAAPAQSTTTSATTSTSAAAGGIATPPAATTTTGSTATGGG